MDVLITYCGVEPQALLTCQTWMIPGEDTTRYSPSKRIFSLSWIGPAIGAMTSDLLDVGLKRWKMLQSGDASCLGPHFVRLAASWTLPVWIWSRRRQKWVKRFWTIPTCGPECQNREIISYSPICSPLLYSSDFNIYCRFTLSCQKMDFELAAWKVGGQKQWL